MEKDTFFGFESVSAAEKVRRVAQVFRSVAGRYDVMNDVMSLGIHRYWKAKLLSKLNLFPQAQIIDVAGGTGDLALSLQKTYPHLDLQMLVCDLTPAMVEVGRDRAINAGLIHGIQWVCGKAEALPFPDASVDIYTIAFGLRNVGEIAQSLAEAARVLRPGGQFVCLEFSQVQMPWWQAVYDAYSFNVIPCLGQWIAGDRESYQYLVESIRRFPDQQALATLMKEAGFTDVQWGNFLGGVSSLHLARR
jgi:demethylmenaquinone methyltransferase/2-methoxy-6-polyprenyl-1,4-benzoquinol methylase